MSPARDAAFAVLVARIPIGDDRRHEVSRLLAHATRTRYTGI